MPINSKANISCDILVLIAYKKFRPDQALVEDIIEVQLIFEANCEKRPEHTHSRRV